MAVTQTSYTGNGTRTNYSFTFPYLKTADVKCSIDATETTAFTLANATTIQFNTAPANGAKIKIFRLTDDADLTATFYAGSAIRSSDLNDNFTQNLYSTQEVNARYLSNLGGTMGGNLQMGEGSDIIFEGATDDANETKLTVADPTADRTITLPDVDGTVVTTGDTGSITSGMIANDAINSQHYVNGSIQDAHIATGTLDNRYYTETELDAGQLDNLYFRQDSSETISSGQTWSAGDTHIATTAAIDARIIDLVDEVGGFDIVANEQSFPDTNPGGTTGQAAVLSIKEATTDLTPTGTTVTITNGNLSSNANITITGLPSSLTTIPQGFGFLVESTTTLHTYTFHRLVPKATEVSAVANNIGNVNTVGNNIPAINTANTNSASIHTVAGSITNVNNVGGSIANVNTTASKLTDIENFNDKYQIASSAPTTDGGGNALAEGDLYFDTTTDELQVYNGGSWQGGVTATGNIAGLSGNTFTDNQNISNEKELRLFEATGNGTSYVGLKAPTNVTNSVTFTLPDQDGSVGHVLQTDGTGNLSFALNIPTALYDWTTASTNPTQVLLAGNGAAEILGNNKLSFDRDPTNANKTSLQAPASQPNDVTFTLPAADGTADQILKTDGNGVLSFSDAASGLVGSSNEKLFVEAENAMDFDFTTTAGNNYVSASPLTLNATLTVVSGSTMSFV